MLSRDLERQSSGDTLWAIASDGGLLGVPVPLTSPTQFLHLAMAERYEVVIDFSQYAVGTQLYLRNVGFTGTIDVDTRTHALMRFDIVREEPDESLLPAVLREVKPIEVPPQATYRRFRFERNQGLWKINNKTWNQNRVDANPQPGDIEVWDLINPGSGWVHPVHIHLIDMQMLSRNGMPPRPYERGWKDVFHVGEFETLRIAGRFGRRDDPEAGSYIKGKYMMHCHNLVHEDHSMMTQFEVGSGGTDPVKGAPARPIFEMRSL
jgi:FtsP/CotA-like multicopper oxidase with cupredoxin domain